MRTGEAEREDEKHPRVNDDQGPEAGAFVFIAFLPLAADRHAPYALRGHRAS